MAYSCGRAMFSGECDGCGLCQRLDCGYDDQEDMDDRCEFEKRRDALRDSVCDCANPFPRRKDRVFRLPLLSFGRSLEAFSLSAHGRYPVPSGYGNRGTVSDYGERIS